MMEEELDYISQSELNKIIDTCEKMLRSGKQTYFDTYQFERIIDHYLENGKFKKASEIAEVALSQHPDNPDIQIRKAKLLIERNNYSEALQLLKPLEKIDSANDEVHFMLGITYSGLKQHKRSETSFEKALAMQSHPEDVEENLYNIALSYINTSNYDKAYKYLKRCLQINTSNSLALYDLAYCAERLDKLDEAVACYQKYLDIEPYAENGWFNLGMIYTREQKYEEAISAFDFSIAINEKFAYAYFNKANALANWEQFREAIEVYEEYLFYDADNYLAYYYIGECYEKLDDFEKSMFYYWKAIDIDKSFADAWFGIGFVKYYQKEYEGSRPFIEKAIELDSNNPEYWYLLGNLHLSMEVSPKECIQAYKKAIRINPGDEEYWISYAKASFQFYDAKTAYRVLSNGIDYISNNAELLFFASAYATYFDMEQAKTHFKEACEISTDEAGEFFNLCNLTIEEISWFKSLITA